MDKRSERVVALLVGTLAVLIAVGHTVASIVEGSAY